jgi:hypothetical protein
MKMPCRRPQCPEEDAARHNLKSRCPNHDNLSPQIDDLYHQLLGQPVIRPPESNQSRPAAQGLRKFEVAIDDEDLAWLFGPSVFERWLLIIPIFPHRLDGETCGGWWEDFGHAAATHES